MYEQIAFLASKSLQCKEIMKIHIFVLHFKSCYSRTVQAVTRQYEWWCAPNKSLYTPAKFERVLLDIYRDIHHFMNSFIIRE